MPEDFLYEDRVDAGKALASLLTKYRANPNAVVLALPRGGVPVAFQVSSRLELPLDVFIVRKLGVPGHEELGFGAIASGGTRVLNDDLIDNLGLADQVVEQVTAREFTELQRRESQYRNGRPAADVEGKVVILIDDGLATGASMRAAAQAIQRHRPARLVVAVPVGAESSCDAFRSLVDEVVCAASPQPFTAVGVWYRDFRQTTDEEVRLLLEKAQDVAAR